MISWHSCYLLRPKEANSNTYTLTQLSSHRPMKSIVNLFFCIDHGVLLMFSVRLHESISSLASFIIIRKLVFTISVWFRKTIDALDALLRVSVIRVTLAKPEACRQNIG
jgi:hypothetical protein